MNLTFQVPMQYSSLQHQSLLPSPVTSTTGCCFCFGSVSSFFLELLLHSFPITYCAPADLGSTSFSVRSLFLSYFSWDSQGKNAEVVCHAILQWHIGHILTWRVHLSVSYLFAFSYCPYFSSSWRRQWQTTSVFLP